MTLRCNNTTDFRSVIAFKGNSHRSTHPAKETEKKRNVNTETREITIYKSTRHVTNTRSMNHEREIDFRFFICFPFRFLFAGKYYLVARTTFFSIFFFFSLFRAIDDFLLYRSDDRQPNRTYRKRSRLVTSGCGPRF